jgi:hypothetical protein
MGVLTCGQNTASTVLEYKSMARKTQPLNQYIIRKIVVAKDVTDALRKEKKQHADEVFIDENWKRIQDEKATTIIGFDTTK